MKLDPEERILLTSEEISAIDKICNDPPPITDYMKLAVDKYKKKFKK